MATIDALRDLIWARDGGLCGICHNPVPRAEMQMDHIQPRALAGPDTIDNLRVAHAECNMRRPEGRRVGPQHYMWKGGTKLQALSRLSVRVPSELLAEQERLARHEHRSLNNLIIHALREWLDDRGRRQV